MWGLDMIRNHVTTGLLNDVGKNGGLVYVLMDDSHPNFNIWRCCIWNGNHYNECFPKGVDPNQKLIDYYGDELADVNRWKEN